MITLQELQALQGEWRVRLDVIEKDWALGWVLAGIANEPALQDWLFKGGTALRKCYYETYRFSEDLDFTATSEDEVDRMFAFEAFLRIAEWVREASGLELHVDQETFKTRKNKRGNPTLLGRVAYRGVLNQPTSPKLKIDITADEVVPTTPVQRQVSHPYSDSEYALSSVRCYSIADLMAEKLRALAQRCRPRDLYDVVFLYRHPDLVGRVREVRGSLASKCEYVGIEVPTLATMRETPFLNEIQTEWENMLAHQLPALPPFEVLWSALEPCFDWLEGRVPIPSLPSAELGAHDVAWRAPTSMISWGSGAPVELIRFAGANRLKIFIDYRAKDGRQGPRLVEPYSLRRNADGALMLYVVNDQRQLRSYRVDRIAGVQITRMPFRPSYKIEF